MSVNPKICWSEKGKLSMKEGGRRSTHATVGWSEKGREVVRGKCIRSSNGKGGTLVNPSNSRRGRKKYEVGGLIEEETLAKPPKIRFGKK